MSVMGTRASGARGRQLSAARPTPAQGRAIEHRNCTGGREHTRGARDRQQRMSPARASSGIRMRKPPRILRDAEGSSEYQSRPSTESEQ